jgi:hypothetical protein
MTIVHCSAFLFLVTLLGYGQAPQKYHRAELSDQAEISVRMLYQQLVSRPIGAIPSSERMKLISPFLSSSLRHRITQARDCGDDWFHSHPQKNVKPPFAWGEFGLFSGADDRSASDRFQIEKMEAENDGSFRVYVRLTEGNPPEKPWTWQVADVVTREGGRYVIDDVIFLKDKDIDTESRLSEILTKGCDGSRWVGSKGGTVPSQMNQFNPAPGAPAPKPPNTNKQQGSS